MILRNVFSYFADWIDAKTNQKYPSTVIEPPRNEIIKVSDKWENDHTECKCGEVSPSARITGAYYAGMGLNIQFLNMTVKYSGHIV